ncbi:hypothetical protein B0H34DRAFT_655910 [Crassisporium funariophilum]|nr:hypothetical protein B0H34DRAFT_655910 [Crassisporium funariophilum]
MITFYDIPSVLPGNAWSPNTWKARLCLNYKGLSYTTEWIEYPDIESHCIKMGIPHTESKPDGSPHYTLPAIYDSSTKAAIADSILIAKYLDEAYPNTPRAFPYHTEAFQFAFAEMHFAKLMPMWQFFVPVVYTRLNPVSKAYFRPTREYFFGTRLEDLTPTGDKALEQWKAYEAALGSIDALSRRTDNIGPYIMGHTVSFADFLIVAYIIGPRIVWGEDSREWRSIKSWHGGRWAALAEAFDKWTAVD